MQHIKRKNLIKKHKVTKTIGSFLSSAAKKATEVNTKYDLTGRSGRALSNGLDTVSKAMEGDTTKQLKDSGK